jgi:glycosyltransferase involved in cell wall biosynthesis
VGPAPQAPPSEPPRIALCHEWLGSRRGSEKTFEAMAKALPRADLFALTRDPRASFDLGGRTPRTTFLDRPSLRDRRQLVLPLMPLAWRCASRERYDLVVTSSHACVKGFWPGRAAVHLSYCYTPMRYVWLPEVDRRTRVAGAVTALPRVVLRQWDRRAVPWVDEFAAISSVVQSRIERFYGRPSEVIHPPVDTEFFTPSSESEGRGREDFVLAVSQMLPYKRLDLAIRACHALRQPLVVAGRGREEGHLRARFVGAPDDEALRELYRSARALVFPGHEDFGIVLAEAQACGTPVVAFGEGGSRDIVLPGETGTLVPSQDVTAFRAALEATLAAPPSPADCRRNAERFGVEVFRRRFLAWVESAAARHGLTFTLAAESSAPAQS